MPVPIPEIVGHEDDLGILALQDLGDVSRFRRISAPRRPKSTRRSIARPCHSFARCQARRGAELRDPKFISYAIAFDVDKLMWEMDFFIKHFLEGYRGVVFAAGRSRRPLRAELGVMVAELRRRTARPLPSGLPQPQSDACRGSALHHRFPGRADGPGHLRPRVAAYAILYMDLTEDVVDELLAYFLARCRGPLGGSPGFPHTFRPHGAPAQLQSPGHVRLSDDDARKQQYIQYMPRTPKPRARKCHQITRAASERPAGPAGDAFGGN